MQKLVILLLSIISTIYVNAQSKNLPSFTAISTSGNVQVELIKSNVTKAEYTIIKGNEGDLVIDVKGDELTVKIKAQKSGLWNRSETKARVKVYYQTISDIDCSAGSSISATEEINADKMEIEASSGANCKVKVQSKNLTVNTSSGASITLEGSTIVAEYDASSGARIDAGYLTSSDANADASSGASISLHASKKIDADASSGGSIKFRGNPERKNIDSGMSGSIKPY
jgi:hypothetical protein